MIEDSALSENILERPITPPGFVGMGALFGANILVFLGLFSLAPVLPSLRAHFPQVANADLLVQMAGAVSGFTFAGACLAAGRVIERHGFRSVYLASLLLFSIAGIAGGLVGNLPMIVLTRALVGIASAGVVNAALVAIGQLLQPIARGRVLGMQSFIGAVSGIVGFPCIGLMTDVDWRLPFALHGVALAFLPMVLALPRAPLLSQVGRSSPKATGVGAAIAFTAIFAGMVAFVANFFGPVLARRLGVTDAGLLAVPPTASAAGMTIGSLAYLIVRYNFDSAAAFSFGLAAMAAGLCVASASNSLWTVAVGCSVCSLGSGIFSPALNSTAIETSPVNPAHAVGLVNALFYGSMILFPLIATPVAEALGGPAAVLLAYAGMATVLAIYFPLRHRVGRRPVG